MKQKKRFDSSFYRQLGSLVVPIAFQNLILSAVGAGDAAMLGFVSQDALAAVSLGTQIQFVLNLFFAALTSGATLISAQYWGKGDKRTVQSIFALIMRYTVVISLVFLLAAALKPEWLMHVFTSDPELVRIGSDYLRITAWSYLPTGLSQCYHCTLKTTGEARRSAIISTIAIVTDILLNAVFIFGLLGMPAMGAKGAALTTVISRCLELALAAACCALKPNRRSLLRPGKTLEKDFWHYSYPLLINSMVWGIGVTMYSVIIGHLGSDVTAANSIAAVIRDLITSLCRGISSGAGIMLGHVMGADKLELAKKYGGRLSRISILCGFISGGLALLCVPAVIHLFTLTEAARHMLKVMLYITAFYMLGRSVNDVVVVGIFNAGGDTKFDAVSVAISMWGFIIPFAAAAAFWLHWPALAVYAIISMDEIIKLPWVYRHYKQYKWVNNITNAAQA